jgi:hypothetical protein
MGTAIGVLWCIFFCGLGLRFYRQHSRTKYWRKCPGRIIKIKKSLGNRIAVVDTSIKEAGRVEFTFNEIGDFQEGETVDCIWDGRDQLTLEIDWRKNQRYGVYFCIAAVLIMVVILTAS